MVKLALNHIKCNIQDKCLKFLPQHPGQSPKWQEHGDEVRQIFSQIPWSPLCSSSLPPPKGKCDSLFIYAFFSISLKTVINHILLLIYFKS